MTVTAVLRPRGLFIFLLLMPFGLFGCGNRPTAPTDTRAVDAAALRELHDQLTRAQNSGDTKVLERTDASDVLVLPPDGSLIAGRQAHMSFFQEFSNKFNSLTDNKSEEIVVSGDWGFDRGTYRYTETPKQGGATVVTEGNYLWLARRESDGLWRYARIIWNTRTPPRIDEQ